MPISLTPQEGNDRPGDAPRAGVIDIGSNSIRLVVYSRLSRAPLPIFNEKVLCGLGRGLDRNARLSPEGVALALPNLRRFRLLSRALGVESPVMLATAAVREAADGPDFQKNVEQTTGLPMTVIAGEEEARLSAQGVLSAFPDAEGVAADLGGGSLELTALADCCLGPRVSLPLGPLRLLESNGERAPQLLGQLAERHFAALPWLSRRTGQKLYLVGGSWRALAKLHMAETNYPLHVIHHYSLPGPTALSYAAAIARMDRNTLEKKPGVARKRLDTLLPAAALLERLVSVLAPTEVIFSAYGLREGHLYDLLSENERKHDPLLAACADLASRQGRFAFTGQLAQWIAPLFPDETPEQARLRQAAAMLSDFAWSEHPDYRSEHAFLRTLRLPVTGIDHPGRVFLALAIYGRYGGKSDDPLVTAQASLLPEQTLRRAEAVGAALRLGQTLVAGEPGLLSSTVLAPTENGVQLILPAALVQLEGDVVNRRLEALAKALRRANDSRSKSKNLSATSAVIRIVP